MAQIRSGASLREIKEQLDVVVEKPDTASFEANVSVLRGLAAPTELTSMLGQIIADEDQLAEIAARSYYHANNFLKLVLMAGDASPWRLRLHVWHTQPDVTEETIEDVHSHRWNFTTALLAGEYCAREFRVDDAGDEYHHLKYLPLGGEESFSLEPQGKARLLNVFEAVLPAGTVYHINHEVLHNISRSGGGSAASLVLQRPAVTEFTNVYRRSAPETEDKVAVTVERPAPVELREELTRFLTWF